LGQGGQGEQEQGGCKQGCFHFSSLDVLTLSLSKGEERFAASKRNDPVDHFE
jgi:hypothetical protein